MSSIFKKIQKLELYKYGNTIDRIVKIVIVFFLIWFYGNLLFADKNNFLILYFIFPLFFAIAGKYFSSISYLYSFALGFLIQWILFLNVNPYPIENRNKMKIMNFVPPEYKPEQEFLLKNMNIQDIENMKYPIIIKPIVCSGDGNGIYIFNSHSEFMKFMMDNKHFDFSEYMIQNYLEGYDVEITILYEHKPWKEKGEIVEITEKTQTDKIRILSMNSINHKELINENILIKIDEISKKIPGFYVGRYDIRLKNLEDLEKGDFKIVEVNGTMGMNIFDNKNMFIDLYYDFIWYWNRITIGGYNMATLNGYGPLHLLRVFLISIKNGFGCNDWENIFSLYS